MSPQQHLKRGWELRGIAGWPAYHSGLRASDEEDGIRRGVGKGGMDERKRSGGIRNLHNTRCTRRRGERYSKRRWICSEVTEGSKVTDGRQELSGIAWILGLRTLSRRRSGFKVGRWMFGWLRGEGVPIKRRAASDDMRRRRREKWLDKEEGPKHGENMYEVQMVEEES